MKHTMIDTFTPPPGFHNDPICQEQYGFRSTGPPRKRKEPLGNYVVTSLVYS